MPVLTCFAYILLFVACLTTFFMLSLDIDILNFSSQIYSSSISILVCLGYYNKNTIHCVADKQKAFISRGFGEI